MHEGFQRLGTTEGTKVHEGFQRMGTIKDMKVREGWVAQGFLREPSNCEIQEGRSRLRRALAQASRQRAADNRRRRHQENC